MRVITADQRALLSERATQPVYLVELFIAGEERFSTNGDRAIGVVSYPGSDIGLSAIDNWQSASIKLRATPARVAQMLSQVWRYGYCRISLLTAMEYPQWLQSDYVEESYAIQGRYQAEPILLLDGELTGAAMSSDKVEFTVSHRVTVGRWLPALRIDPPLCNHLPRPGEVIVWENEKFTLEAR